MLLRHADLAERVFVSDLEMQRGQVIHHQRHRPGRSGMPPAGSCDLGAVVPLHAPGQALVQRVRVWRWLTQLAQHPDRVQLRGRLHDPCPHQLGEHCVGHDIESKLPVGALQHVPQKLAGRVLDHQTGRRPPLRLKTRDLVLHTVQPLQRHTHQYRHLDGIVS